jgi:hypothetical protein
MRSTSGRQKQGQLAWQDANARRCGFVKRFMACIRSYGRGISVGQLISRGLRPPDADPPLLMLRIEDGSILFIFAGLVAADSVETDCNYGSRGFHLAIRKRREPVDFIGIHMSHVDATMTISVQQEDNLTALAFPQVWMGSARQLQIFRDILRVDGST